VHATRLLESATLPGYEQLTFPLFRPRLRDTGRRDGLVAVGAAGLTGPTGLALAELPPGAEAAELLSVYVRPGLRRLGLGTALLSRLEDELSARRCKAIHGTYTTSLPELAAVERLLAKDGWAPPVRRMLFLHGRVADCLDSPWVKAYRLRAGDEVFSWAGLTAADRAAMLRRQAESPWYPQSLSPFQDEAIIDGATSVGVRRRGEVVAWQVTHRIAPDLVRYTAAWARSELQPRGYSVVAMAEAFRRQVQAGIPKFVLGVRADNAPMLRIFERKMIPYAASVSESRGSFKGLETTGHRGPAMA
jgi:ribosomal protein S18 acetylase RimI-like enzyme